MQPSCSSNLSQAEFAHLQEIFDELLHKPQQSKFSDFCSQHLYHTQRYYQRASKKKVKTKLELKCARSKNRIKRRISASSKQEEVLKKLGNKRQKVENGDNKLTYQSENDSYSSSFCFNTMPAFVQLEITVENSPNQLDTQQVEVLQMPAQERQEQSEEETIQIAEEFAMPLIRQQFQNQQLTKDEIGESGGQETEVEQVRMQIQKFDF